MPRVMLCNTTHSPVPKHLSEHKHIQTTSLVVMFIDLCRFRGRDYIGKAPGGLPVCSCSWGACLEGCTAPPVLGTDKPLPAPRTQGFV